MFQKGDLIIYSTHGVCKVVDICEKTFRDVTRDYYTLHPIDDPELLISAPVDSDQVVMLDIMNKEEARELLSAFENPGVEWIEDAKTRNRKYKTMIDGGDRNKIVKIATTLMIKEREAKAENGKMYDQDVKMLEHIQGIMFQELAASLETSVDKIIEHIQTRIPAKTS